MTNTPLSLETLAIRVATIEKAISENSESHGKLYARIETVEKGQAVINTNLDNIEKLCNEICADVKTLKEKPAKRYDALVNSVMQWLVLAILGAVVVFR